MPRFSLSQEAQASQSFAEALGSLAFVVGLVSCPPGLANALPSRGFPRKGGNQIEAIGKPTDSIMGRCRSTLYQTDRVARTPMSAKLQFPPNSRSPPVPSSVAVSHPYAVISQTLNNQFLFYLPSFLFPSLKLVRSRTAHSLG